MSTKYTGKDNCGNPKSEYLKKIAKMDDAALFDETKDKIYLSAYASKNPRSDYHWHVDACHDECQKRGKPEIYQRAHDYRWGSSHESTPIILPEPAK